MSLGLRLLLVFALLYSAEGIGARTEAGSTNNVGTSLRRELEEKATNWQIGIHGVSGWPSDDTKARYGFGLLIENDALRPLAIQANISWSYSKFKTIFPGQSFRLASVALDVLYRPWRSETKPYLGCGVDAIFSRYPTGEPVTDYRQPYDEYTPIESMDFGSRTGFHVSVGIQQQVSTKFSITLDLRRSATLISTPVVVTGYPSGIVTNETRDYRLGALSMRVGLIYRVYK